MAKYLVSSQTSSVPLVRDVTTEIQKVEMSTMIAKDNENDGQYCKRAVALTFSCLLLWPNNPFFCQLSPLAVELVRQTLSPEEGDHFAV